MDPNTSFELFDKVMGSLGRDARRTAYRRFALRLVALVVAVVTSVIALRALLVAANDSGFFAYLSLLFSDGSAVLSQGSDFATIVLETLPVTHLFVAASLALITLWTLAAFVREARMFRQMLIV